MLIKDTGSLHLCALDAVGMPLNFNYLLENFSGACFSSDLKFKTVVQELLSVRCSVIYVLVFNFLWFNSKIGCYYWNKFIMSDCAIIDWGRSVKSYQLEGGNLF